MERGPAGSFLGYWWWRGAGRREGGPRSQQPLTGSQLSRRAFREPAHYILPRMLRGLGWLLLQVGAVSFHSYETHQDCSARFQLVIFFSPF